MTELITTIPAIVVIAYLIGAGCKAIDKIPDKLIPVIVGAAGGVLGVVGMYTSGLASTGVNQIVKQLRQET